LRAPAPGDDASITNQRGLTNLSGIEALTSELRYIATEEEEEEREDEEIEEIRSSPVKRRGTKDVSACGGAWARFAPRLKTDKDIGSASSARQQGSKAVCRVRWGVIPPVADTLVAAVAVASVTPPLPERSFASPGGSGCMISLHLPFPPRSPPSRFKYSYCIFFLLFFSFLLSA